MGKKKLAVFASGNGTNAEKIFRFFQSHKKAEVSLLCCNKKDAFVLERAKKFNLPTLVFNRSQFYDSSMVTDRLQKEGIDLVVLAGFMWLIPSSMVARYPQKIINIHPALLPKYGGKGLYGMHVHRAVKEAGESESGITIHYVNECYDEGTIIAQFACELNPTDSPADIAQKVQKLEHKNYPKVIENLDLKY